MWHINSDIVKTPTIPQHNLNSTLTESRFYTNMSLNTTPTQTRALPFTEASSSTNQKPQRKTRNTLTNTHRN